MQIRIAAVLSVVFAVSGCRVVEPEPAPAAPRIDSFTASKTRTAPGESVTLTFTTTGASKVEITDDSGASVQLSGEPSSGTATVAPTRTAFYVLRATGAGGRDTAFVQIAVNEPLKDLFLIAVPATINSGDEGQLLWGAPGAASVTLKPASAAATTLMGTTGSVTVTPAFTEQYTLTAQGAPGTPPLTALATIEVRPVLKTAAVAAMNGVKPGETITLSWTTVGAQRVTVSEQTFGQLTSVTDAAAVATGSFDYVLPANLPNGVAITDGLPLHFVVSASAGAVTVTKTLDEVVGDLPVIEALDAPEFGSSGTNFAVSWKTLNATQITITVGGLPVFQTLPNNQARVDEGSVDLPVPNAQTEYTLVASNDRGASARRVFNVRPVPLPAITMYTLTPTINALGDPATARWMTTGATRIQLRFENGPTLAVITTPPMVTSGTFVLTPATSGRVVLEAYNAAGDVVTDVKPFTFTGTSVTITPTPVVRGAMATLNWTLAPAGVIETVGLPTPAPAPVTASPNFVDLAMDAAATEVVIDDPANGSAQVVQPLGFRFPLLGQLRPEIWVSVNGFITFSAPSALPANIDFTAMNDNAPTMLAPFWDDLAMGMTSKVFSKLATATNGERYLIVQWDKVQLAADTNSELTFQVHLYETGQVTFIYQTLTGAVNSATVGVKDPAFPLIQQYAYNSNTSPPSNLLELSFFTGGPPSGMLTLTAGRSRRVEFFGRTATGLVPASAELRSFGQGDVTITEAMPFPEASSSMFGQWIELQNNADVAVDFENLVVDSLGSMADGGYVIPGGTVVPAGGFLVLGQSLDMTETGGAPVTQVVSDLPLGSVDRLRVSLEGTVLSTLSWDAGSAGTSIQGGTVNVLVASGMTAPACARMVTFGSAGAIGSPGAANESCAPYTVTQIAGGYRTPPLSAGVTFVQVTTFDAWDEGQVNITLPTPFTYFGTPVTRFSMSPNGFITFGPPLTSSMSVFTNPTLPETTEPNSVVAAFWDDLKGNTGYQASAWRDSDRYIVAWERFYAFSVTTTFLDFQIHLLDSGVIEFHYGALIANSGTASDLNRVSGDSASIWLESPSGALAVPWSVNRANAVVPFSGLRFTPRP